MVGKCYYFVNRIVNLLMHVKSVGISDVTTCRSIFDHYEYFAVFMIGSWHNEK